MRLWASWSDVTLLSLSCLTRGSASARRASSTSAHSPEYYNASFTRQWVKTPWKCSLLTFRLLRYGRVKLQAWIWQASQCNVNLMSTGCGHPFADCRIFVCQVSHCRPIWCKSLSRQSQTCLQECGVPGTRTQLDWKHNLAEGTSCAFAVAHNLTAVDTIVDHVLW